MTYLEWVDDVIHDPSRSGAAGIGLALCTAIAVAVWHPLVAAPYQPGDPGLDVPLKALLLPFLMVGGVTFLALSPLFYGLHRAWTPPPEPTPELDEEERLRRLRALLPRLT